MPLYDYKCREHGVFDAYAPMSLSSEPQPCPGCGEPAEKVILHAPRVFGDIEPFISPATGQIVQGKRGRREDMLRTGCREWEGLESEQRHHAKKQEVADAEVDAQIEEAVERAANELRN